MSVEVAQAAQLHLKPCKHQVAGHLFEEGKAGSLVDDRGHFYKPLQVGPRGERERAFYELIARELRQEASLAGAAACGGHARGGIPGGQQEAGVSGRAPADGAAAPALPFSLRNATMLQAIPRFYGSVEFDGRQMVELEDVARGCRHPCIADIKVGTRTWYAGADARYIERCKLKDAATTQAALGFKVCGMQVYRPCQGGYWRASKRWCKKLPLEEVSRALVRFASNDVLQPADVYGGPNGAIAQLRRLEAWFQEQREFHFYSSSVLLIYEGDAETAAEASVSVRLVDFAHTFPSNGKKDTNFLAGLRAVIHALTAVLELPAAGGGDIP